MNGQDAEIQHLKDSVSYAALLERLPPVWRLDRAESTRRCLKYRRGASETVVVNHDGRSWWDPWSEAKGDIFSLVQHLEPSSLRSKCCPSMLESVVTVTKSQ
jgi:hypothetical protein